MKRSINILVFIFLNSFVCRTEAQEYEITSPDSNIGVLIEVGKSISYSVKYKDKILICPSGISMSFHPDIFSGKEPVVSDTITRFINSTIVPVVKEKRAVIPDIYKELILRFNNHFELSFRVYNDGVAYRFASGLTGETRPRRHRPQIMSPKPVPLIYQRCVWASSCASGKRIGVEEEL